MKELIIIGAARSGTNMLRDLLSSTGAISTWPCDEINYIWRYNHASHPNDVFSPEMAGEKEKKYIENQFRKISRKYKTDWVLEKTCANTLRVPFVNAVFLFYAFQLINMLINYLINLVNKFEKTLHIYSKIY